MGMGNTQEICTHLLTSFAEGEMARVLDKGKRPRGLDLLLGLIVPASDQPDP